MDTGREKQGRPRHEALPDVPHAIAAADLLHQLSVDPGTGLASHEVADRQKRYGPNRLPPAQLTPAWKVLLHQFASPVVALLAAAVLVALLFDEWVEAGAILIVLVLNTLIGFFTEIRAIRSIEALQSLGSHSAKCLREGSIRIIDAAELVPGDIVRLEAGDAAPADLRLLDLSNLAVDESTFTGESLPVDKSVDPVPADARLAERSSMLFMGTSAVRGSATGIVVAIGAHTELGRISALADSTGNEKSPLERGLARLAGQMVWLTLVLAALIAASGLLRGQNPLLIATTTIALAVAAIPEGLPVVATLTLARGIWRMAGKNALVERLSAVETLGSTTLILTDKTGTLTENRMRVARIALPSGFVDFNSGSAADLARDPQLLDLLRAGTLCNDASLGEDSEHAGDPMEVALLQAGAMAGLERRQALSAFPLVRSMAFDSALRMMATIHSDEGGFLYAVKGAPEAVLACCSHERREEGAAPIGTTALHQWHNHISLLAHEGLRVLALATKRADRDDCHPYEGLVLLGMVGLEDPARTDVPEAIRTCHEAGVKVAMVTGDHVATANTIGRKVGIDSKGVRPLEGSEVASMQADRDLLRETQIFARVNPDEKLLLVQTFQDAGDVVAMTGDGVNDAPALRKADIGVAMGMRGTDVAREAADMVLLDDSFATIPVAIREGRIIFENIRRFAAYLLACNLSEVLVVGTAILAGMPLPLLPLQILYLNLVTDVFPAFALAMGEGEDGVMKRPPRPPGEAILDRPQWRRLVLHGLVLSIAAFGALAIGISCGLEGDALLTVTFLTIASGQILHVFNMRSAGSHPLSNEVTRNPWVWAAIGLCVLLLAVPLYVGPIAVIFHLVPPTLEMWAIIGAMSTFPLVVLQGWALLSGRLVRIRAQ